MSWAFLYPFSFTASLAFETISLAQKLPFQRAVRKVGERRKKKKNRNVARVMYRFKWVRLLTLKIWQCFSTQSKHGKSNRPSRAVTSGSNLKWKNLNLGSKR